MRALYSNLTFVVIVGLAFSLVIPEHAVAQDETFDNLTLNDGTNDNVELIFDSSAANDESRGFRWDLFGTRQIEIDGLGESTAIFQIRDDAGFGALRINSNDVSVYNGRIAFRNSVPLDSLDVSDMGIKAGGLDPTIPKALFLSRNEGPTTPIPAAIQLIDDGGASPVTADRNMLDLQNLGGVRVSLKNNATDVGWLMATDATDRLFWRIIGPNNPQLEIRKNGSMFFNNGGAQTLQLQNNGNLVIPQGTVRSNAFVQLSDRNAKEDFVDIDPVVILAKVKDLPVTTWRFKSDKETTKHIGPVAQDFYAAFEVGSDNKTITTTDGVGVALAAIQGLNKIVEEKSKQISELKAENEELKAQNSEILKRLERIEAAILQQHQ